MANPFLNPFLAPQMAADASDPSYLTPEEEESLTRSLLRNSMGLLEAVGYALDTPGAYLRGALSGRVGERRSGREMLTDWGVTSANDPNAWEAADFAGIAADIAFDPLTYMTFGAGALGRAGKAVRAAGGAKQIQKIAAQKIANQTGENADQILKTLGPRRAKMTTTLEDVYTYGDDTLRQNLDKVINTKQLNKNDLIKQELGGLFGLDIPFTDIAKAVGTGETAQKIAGRLDVAAKTLAYAPGIRHAAALFDTPVKGSTRASIQKNLRENADELEQAHAAGREALYDTFKKLGDIAGDNKMLQVAVAATDDQIADPRFFERMGVATPTEEQLSRILPMRDVVNKQKAKVIENGGDIQDLDDPMVVYFPSTRLGSNFAQGQDPQGLIAGGMREMPITSTYSKHREEVFNNLPGRAENIRVLTTSPEVSGPKSTLTDEADRVDFIFRNTPGIRMLAEDAAEAEGMSLDDLVASTKAKIGERDWTPETAVDKQIAQEAAKYGYRPVVVKKYAEQYADRLNAENAFDASVYPEVMKGMLSPSAWKAIKNAGVKDADSLQRAGIPLDLIGERLAEADLIPKRDFGGYSEDAFAYLQAKGSPYAALKKGGVLGEKVAQDPEVISKAISAFSDQIAAESADFGKLSPTEEVIAGLFDKSKQLSKYLRNTSPEYSKFATPTPRLNFVEHPASARADEKEVMVYLDPKKVDPAWANKRPEVKSSPSHSPEFEKYAWQIPKSQFEDMPVFQHSSVRKDAPEVGPEGFSSGIGPNVVPATRGEPSNIMQSRWGTKEGVPVYIVPKSAVVETRNGPKIKQGYVPGERLVPSRNYQPLHEIAVENALKKGYEVPEEVIRDYPELAAKYKRPTESPMYIAPGKESIQGRRAQFEEFLKTGEPIQAPRIDIDDRTGAVKFADGRHRFAVLRDMGEDTIGVMVPASKVSKIRQKFGAQAADTGLTSTHVAESLADYVTNTDINTSMLKAIIGSLADEAVDVPKGQNYVPVEEVMNFVGLGRTVKEGEPRDLSMAMERFVEALGRQGKSANSVYVPADIAQDITKLYEKRNEGWFLKGIDKATSLIKSGLTMAPAFHARNRTSGLMQSILDGALSFQSPSDAKRSLRTILTAGRIATGTTPKGLAKNRYFQSELGASATDEEALSKLEEMLSTYRVIDDQYMDQIAKAGARIADPEKYGKAKVGDVVQNLFTGKENLVQSEGVTRRGKQVRKYPEGALEATVSQPDVYQTFGGRTAMERALASQPLSGLMTIKDVAKGFGSDVASGVSDIVQPLRAKGSLREKAAVAAQNLREGPLNPFNIAGVRGEASRSALSKVHERFGRMVEVNNRVEAFLGLLDQGMAPAEAAARVRSLQVDYSKLSPFERSTMRRVAPFYTFTRRFGEHLARNLMERPGGGSGQVIKIAAGQRSDESFLPDYVGEGVALPNPLSKDSYVTGLGLALEGPLSLGAVQYKDGMIDPGKTLMRTAQKMGSQISPMIRGPIELMTGRSLYTGRPLQENWQYPIMNPQSTSAVLANAMLANSPASRWITTSRKLSDERKTAAEKALNLLTGISTTNLSGGVENAKEFQVRKAVDELLSQSPRIRSYEARFVPPDMKDKLTPEEQQLLGFRKLLVNRAKAAAKQKEKEKAGK